MMRLLRPAHIGIGLCCLLQGACAGVAADAPQTYVVRREDTLYSIAWRHDVDFRDLARWNHLGADFHISVGQVLLLGQGATAPSATAPRAPSRPLNAASPWVWPTASIGAPQRVAHGGILLSGRLGQDVRAASGGRVVYTGSGLRGYGNLIIIKHADSLLSAYAHTRETLVHDGEDVAAGAVIAHMGEGAHHAPILYFEIRQNGTPIDPLPFFSK